jgi:hypothetical protein
MAIKDRFHYGRQVLTEFAKAGAPWHDTKGFPPFGGSWARAASSNMWR